MAHNDRGLRAVAHIEIFMNVPMGGITHLGNVLDLPLLMLLSFIAKILVVISIRFFKVWCLVGSGASVPVDYCIRYWVFQCAVPAIRTTL